MPPHTFRHGLEHTNGQFKGLEPNKFSYAPMLRSASARIRWIFFDMYQVHLHSPVPGGSAFTRTRRMCFHAYQSGSAVTRARSICIRPYQLDLHSHVPGGSAFTCTKWICIHTYHVDLLSHAPRGFACQANLQSHIPDGSACTRTRWICTRTYQVSLH